jgi:ankyrin repeat protein
MPPLNLHELPLEIIYYLAADSLDYADVLTLAQTCRTLWHFLYADGYAPIWRTLYRRDLSRHRVPDQLHAKVQGVIMSDLQAMLALPRFLEVVRRGYEVVIPLYLSQLVPMVRSEALNRALGLAARYGHTDVFDWILTQQSGFDLYYAMCGSAEANRYDLLQKLVPQMTLHLPTADAQAIASLTDPFSECFRLYLINSDAALYGAAKSGNTEFVRKLISLRPNNLYIGHALYGAAEGGHADLLNEVLLQSPNQDYAVNYAARGGHDRLVRHILRQGNYIDSALIGAAVGGHLNLFLKLYHRGGKNLEASLDAAAYHGRRDILNLILTLEPTLDLTLPLIFAIGHGHLPIVQRLLDLGAKFRASAIVAATTHGYPEIADVLTQWVTKHPVVILPPLVAT